MPDAIDPPPHPSEPASVARLRQLATGLMLEQERLRRRIATELHGGAAQGLVAAQIELSLLERAGGSANRDFARLHRALEAATADVRRLMAELAPAGLSEPRIGAGIVEMARHFGRTRGLTVEAKDDGEPKPMDADARILLYQCVTELLRNAVAHGRSVWLGVRTRAESGQLVVEIEDRGIGFEPATRGSRAGPAGGLFGVRERLRLLRGSMRIRSSPGSGTLVTLTVPMQREVSCSSSVSGPGMPGATSTT